MLKKKCILVGLQQNQVIFAQNFDIPSWQNPLNTAGQVF